MNSIAAQAKALAEKAHKSSTALMEWHQRCQTSHLSSSLSCLDILNFLLRHRMRCKEDVLVLSKGHAASALYVLLAEEGFIPQSSLETYSHSPSEIPGHVPWTLPRPILCGSGSLGYGCSLAAGWAYAEKLANPTKPSQAYCIISDGELNSGVFWESLASLSHHQIGNIEIYIDLNGLQAYGSTLEVLNMNPIPDKLKSFGCEVFEVAGHDYTSFLNLPPPQPKSLKPRAILCKTQKGNGLSSAPATFEVHYKRFSK